MAKDPGYGEGQHPVKGIAADILKEVIQADMSMHMAQIEAWQWFAKNRPKGELINDDIYEGFARNLYLSLSELKLQLYVKPVKLTFWSRFQLAFKVLFHRALPMMKRPVVLEIASKQDVTAMVVDITVTRHKNGTVQADYRAADKLTEELLK